MARVFEESAGGVVYRRSSDGTFEILLLKWKNSKNKVIFTIPKWHIQEGESASEAALREISEETGIDKQHFEIRKFIKKISFSFTARHKTWAPTIDKDVHMFLVEFTGNVEPRVQRDERFVGFQWIAATAISTVRMRPNISDIVKENLGFM